MASSAGAEVSNDSSSSSNSPEKDVAKKEAIHAEISESLSKRLSNLQIPSLSAVAMKGDDKLVSSFLSETVAVKGDTDTVKQSQLYIASFWGFADVVKSLVESGCGINYQNEGTLWTPLHAATLQEHGKVVMLLLQNSADPELKDSQGRTPKDFASASQKTWPHFAALGYSRTSKQDLISKGIIKKVEQVQEPPNSNRSLRMASFGSGRPGSAYTIQNPHTTKTVNHHDSRAMAACLGGDVLANAPPVHTGTSTIPQLGFLNQK